MDVAFRYGAQTGETQVRAIGSVREVYGIRRIVLTRKSARCESNTMHPVCRKRGRRVAAKCRTRSIESGGSHLARWGNRISGEAEVQGKSSHAAVLYTGNYKTSGIRSIFPRHRVDRYKILAGFEVDQLRSFEKEGLVKTTGFELVECEKSHSRS
jgi:hypothetical protein